MGSDGQRSARRHLFLTWVYIPRVATTSNFEIQGCVEEIHRVSDNSTVLFLIVDTCRTAAPEGTKGDPKAQSLQIHFSKMLKQHVIWFATSHGRIAQAGGKDEMSLFTSCLHEHFERIAKGDIPEVNKVSESEDYYEMVAMKTMVHKQVMQKVRQIFKSNHRQGDVQEPHWEAKNAEAFTFALPPSLCVSELPSSEMCDPRWSKLLEDGIVGGAAGLVEDLQLLRGRAEVDALPVEGLDLLVQR